jgi:hypothetical protein
VINAGKVKQYFIWTVIRLRIQVEFIAEKCQRTAGFPSAAQTARQTQEESPLNEASESISCGTLSQVGQQLGSRGVAMIDELASART